MKNCGNFTGRITASFSESLAPSKPATSSHCRSAPRTLTNYMAYHKACCVSTSCSTCGRPLERSLWLAAELQRTFTFGRSTMMAWPSDDRNLSLSLSCARGRMHGLSSWPQSLP